MCPLEAALRSSGFISTSRCDMDQFTQWIVDNTFNRMESFSYFGGLRSVRLFRSRKRPFNHEYAVLCFASATVPESWVKMERAALLPPSPYVPTLTNVGVAFGGEMAKDSVSFACSLADLVHKSDQLACIEYECEVLDARKHYDFSRPPPTQLIISDIARRAHWAQMSFPQYHLLSANCRWFARQTFFTLMQSALNAGASYRLTWKRRSCSLDYLSRKLGAEKFGGEHLEGRRGVFLRAANVLELYNSRVEQDSTQELMCRLSTEAIEALEAIAPPSEAEVDVWTSLLCRVLSIKGTALCSLGQTEEGLRVHGRACGIARGTCKGLQSELLLPDAAAFYARDLSDAGRITEACSVQQTSIDATIEHLRPAQDHNLAVLAARLLALARYQHARNDLPSSQTTVERVLDILRPSFSINPSRWWNIFPVAWKLKSVFLYDMGQYEAACNAASSGVAAARRSSQSQQDYFPKTRIEALVDQLRWYGRVLSQNGNHAQALSALTESVTHVQALFGDDPAQVPPSQRRLLCTTLEWIIALPLNLDGRHEQERALRLIVPSLREVVIDESLPEDRSKLCTYLRRLAIRMESSDWTGSFDLIKETVIVSRLLNTSDDTPRLWSSQYILAMEDLERMLLGAIELPSHLILDTKRIVDELEHAAASSAPPGLNAVENSFQYSLLLLKQTELLVEQNQLKIALATASELLTFLGPFDVLISDGSGHIAFKGEEIYLSATLLLGWTHNALGNTDKAIHLLRNSLLQYQAALALPTVSNKTRQSYAAALKFLSTYLQTQGNTGEALGHWRTWLQVRRGLIGMWEADMHIFAELLRAEGLEFEYVEVMWEIKALYTWTYQPYDSES